MIFYRIEGFERLKEGAKKNTLLKNGDDWELKNTLNSYVCLFKSSSIGIKSIFNHIVSEIAELHKCKKNEKILLLQINNINDDFLIKDDTGSGGIWNLSIKYNGDIELDKDIIIIGDSKVINDNSGNFEISNLDLFKNPLSVKKYIEKSH